MTDITIRNPLNGWQQKSLISLAKRQTVIIITNSDPRGVEDGMLSREAKNEGIVFVGEHGQCAKFESNGVYEMHPDLTVDVTVLPEIDRLMVELLTADGIPVTREPTDLHKGKEVIKLEQKQTCYATVRAISGFSQANQASHIQSMNAKMKDAMVKVGDEFKLKQNGWALHEGPDAFEWIQRDASKIDGFEWVKDRLALTGDHEIYEDGGDAFLKWAYETYGAKNFLVVNKPSVDNPSHIFAQLNGIDSFWQHINKQANNEQLTHVPRPTAPVQAAP